MEMGVAELALALLGATALALLALWMYRLVQYRKAVRRSQARWLAYEPAPVLTEEELGLNWPSLKPILLSPIPEERHESGRESENDSMLSVRRDSLRLSTISVIAYGSFDQPVAKAAKVADVMEKRDTEVFKEQRRRKECETHSRGYLLTKGRMQFRIHSVTLEDQLPATRLNYACSTDVSMEHVISGLKASK